MSDYIFDSQDDAYRPVKAPQVVSHLVTAVVAVMVALSAAALARGEFDMSQASFPCVEDEVLGYAPQFGPDRVGCIHIEEIK